MVYVLQGKFTGAQRILYEALLEIQETCVQECVVGRTLQDNHNNMLALIAKQLQKMDIISKKSQTVSPIMVSTPQLPIKFMILKPDLKDKRSLLVLEIKLATLH